MLVAAAALLLLLLHLQAAHVFIPFASGGDRGAVPGKLEKLNKIFVSFFGELNNEKKN